MEKKILFEKEGKKKLIMHQRRTTEEKEKKISEIYVKRLSFDYWTMEKVSNVHVTIAEVGILSQVAYSR